MDRDCFVVKIAYLRASVCKIFPVAGEAAITRPGAVEKITGTMLSQGVLGADVSSSGGRFSPYRDKCRADDIRVASLSIPPSKGIRFRPKSGEIGGRDSTNFAAEIDLEDFHGRLASVARGETRSVASLVRFTVVCITRPITHR